MTTSRLSEIKQRLAQATPGPWTLYERKRDFKWNTGRLEQYASADIMAPSCPVASMGDIEFPLHKPTAEFIAHAPEDIALLLSVAEAAKEVVRRYREDSGQDALFAVRNELSDALAPLLSAAPREGE